MQLAMQLGWEAIYSADEQYARLAGLMHCLLDAYCGAQSGVGSAGGVLRAVAALGAEPLVPKEVARRQRGHCWIEYARWHLAVPVSRHRRQESSGSAGVHGKNEPGLE